MNKPQHDMTIAGTAARLRASIAWLREGTPTQNGGIGVADMEAMLPIIEREAAAARTCAVCGRPPHVIDDPECMPATKPIAERLAWALAELERVRANVPQWQPIATAPKALEPLLLWLPPVGAWTAGPWRGSWSFVDETWVLHTPFVLDGKAVCLSENPEPTHWQPMPRDALNTPEGGAHV